MNQLMSETTISCEN